MLIASVISVLALGAGCSRTQESDAATTDSQAKIARVTVDELDHLLAASEAQAVDANGDLTRRKMGVIPGAVLLRDADSIDALPADKAKHLVFYCANTSCGASHHAAHKALTAGYTHVQVLPEGIAGWVKAGKKTASI